MSNKTLIEWNADVGTRLLTIHPDGSFDIDKDAPPLFVIGELAKAFIRQQQRIKQLEEELERTKQDRNAIAKNTREPLLLKLDHANERINRLEDRINRASIAFFEDGSDARIARWMMDILEEERRQK